MRKPEPQLQIRPRPAETVEVRIPTDTLASLDRVAERRDISREALLKLYVGQGLRQDLSRLFADSVLESAAEVLSRHIPSEEEVEAIVQELRASAAS